MRRKLKVYEDGRTPWVVRVARCGDKISVSFVEDLPEGKPHESNNGASCRPACIARTKGERLVSPSKADKVIARMQSECTQMNRAELEAQQYVSRLAQETYDPQPTRPDPTVRRRY